MSWLAWTAGTTLQQPRSWIPQDDGFDSGTDSSMPHLQGLARCCNEKSGHTIVCGPQI